MADAIYEEGFAPENGAVIVDPLDAIRRRRVSSKLQFEELLVPAVKNGQRLWANAPLVQAQQRARIGLAAFDAGIKRFSNPHRYPAGLEVRLHEKKMQMVERAANQRLERADAPDGTDGESVASVENGAI